MSKYPHMCRDGHEEIGHSSESEMCPLCYATAINERMEEALQRIVQWADAYPLDVFPEPDFKLARHALERAGLTLDAVSASNMRHVVTGVGGIAREALKR